NAGRDVKDFYEVQFKDASMQEYMYNGEWKKSTFREEKIVVRDQGEKIEKIAMTEWGPVMFDTSYKNMNEDGKYYAVRWTAHDASNELLTFYQLNRAKNHADYLAATEYFYCPGQNFVFASKTNEIAWWQQAVFPAKWRRQGDFVMPGWDTTFAWKANIPSLDNINMVNPERGFVSSANQMPADTTYPFYLGGIHDVYRGLIINRYLMQTGGATPEGMQAMQTDNYNVFAEMARPLLLKMTDRTALSGPAADMLTIFENWSLKADAQEKGQTIFTEWWNALADTIWLDDITRPDSLPVIYPQAHTLLEALLRDTAFAFVDNRLTPQKETLPQLVTAALQTAADRLKDAPLDWATFKATGVRHFLHSSLPVLSRQNLLMGGGRFIINATTGNHGPSWRMVVHMTDEVEAYGIYPGGQNGNPGSKYYDQFVNDWAAGRYNRIKKYPELAAAAADKGWRMMFKSKKG
nr:penicillin acylase family protein [Chitinophagaceae bacterium]